MAATQAGERLTQRFYDHQLVLRASLLEELLRLWQVVDPQRPRETADTWLNRVIEAIISFFAPAKQQAATYYDSFRIAETGSGLAHDIEQSVLKAVVPNEEQMRASLMLTGPLALQRNIEQGMDVKRAADTGLVSSSGTAARLVLNAARDTVNNLSAQDVGARGFIRVTGPNPCYFCALLASRGPVYFSAQTAGARNRTSVRNLRSNREFVGEGQYKFHDHCQCTIEPVFKDGPWPGKAREYEQLWKDVTGPYTGQGKMRAFRRAYNAKYSEQAA